MTYLTMNKIAKQKYFQKHLIVLEIMSVKKWITRYIYLSFRSSEYYAHTIILRSLVIHIKYLARDTTHPIKIV